MERPLNLIADDFFGYLGRHFPQQCASDEFYFLPRSETAIQYLNNLDDLSAVGEGGLRKILSTSLKYTMSLEEVLETAQQACQMLLDKLNSLAKKIGSRKGLKQIIYEKPPAVSSSEKVLELYEKEVQHLCGGQGRHSLEMSRRGNQDMTVLDYSKILNDIGKRIAHEEGLNTLFIQKDARDTGFPDRTFRIIIVMASSFGYFGDEEENQKILQEAFRILMPKGLLLLDLPHR